MEDLASDVLVIEHESACPPGMVATVLERSGLDMHLFQPHRGQQLPEDLAGYEGMVVLGGGMGALDDADHPWLGRVRRLLALAADRHLPTLGICLGAQLAALALEGRMGRREKPSRGLQEITLTEAGRADPVLSALGSQPPIVFHWHQDRVAQLPPYSELLATGADEGVQAYRAGTALWAVQFHPELTAQIAEEWARDSSLAHPDLPPQEVRAQVEDAAAARDSWRALLEAFAHQVHTD